MNNSLAKKQISVLIVEDHPLTATGLEATVRGMEGCRLVGVAMTTAEARRLAESDQPDVITLDLRLGGSTAAGIQLARDLRSRAPDSHILVCSAFAFEGDVTTLVNLGIEGYVVKTEPPSVIAAAIRALAEGRTFFSRPVSQIVQRVLRGSAQGKGPERPLLGPDEIETLRRAASGLTSGKIAQRLSVSPSTVTRRLNQVFKVLGVGTRAEAIAKAAQLGYLDGG